MFRIRLPWERETAVLKTMRWMHLVIAFIALLCFLGGATRSALVMFGLLVFGAFPLGGAYGGLAHYLVPWAPMGVVLAFGIVANWLTVWAGIHSLRNWARRRAIRLGQRSDSSPYVERAAPGPASSNESTPRGS